MYLALYIFDLVVCLWIINIKGRSSNARNSIGIVRVGLVAVFLAALSPLIDCLNLYSTDRVTNAYHYSFYYSQHLDDPSFVLFDGFQEPGWSAFNMAFRLLTDDYGVVLFTISFIYNYSSLLLLRSLAGASFRSAASIFVLSLGPLYTLSQSSQFLALAISNIALLCLILSKKRRFGALLFGVFCILSFTVHTSALITPALVILGWLLINNRTKATVFFVVGIACAASAVFILPSIATLFPILQETMRASFSGQSQGVLVALKSIPFLLIAIDALLAPSSRHHNHNGLFWPLWLFVACAGMSFISAVGNYWLWRIAMYGLVPSALMSASEEGTAKYTSLQLAAIALQIVLTLREAAILYPAGMG